MQQLIYLASLYLVLLSSCQSKAEPPAEVVASEEAVVQNPINPAGKTVAARYNPPAGFKRTTAAANSFAAYLQQFPLKPHGAKVHYYNGAVKLNKAIYDAVLDIDVGTQDLQQCADAVMRLRAEHLYQQKRYSDIHFNFTSGFRADYSKWQQGNRIKVSGNNCTWQKTAAPSTAYASFKAYLQQVFMYAGTLSLEKEMKPVMVEALQIGDVFIIGGSPGHAVIVMDVAVNAKGEKVFLLAQSYMPAQEIHILQNPTNSTISPWYSSTFSSQLLTPEWTFQRSHLRRFEGE